jgi:alpha-L-rhamnosidase
MGATTIWERWNGIKPDGSFEVPSMNSFNHYAYGAIGDWMYRVVAGLDTDESEPGYKRITVKPHIGGGLTHAQADLETYYGKASSGWKLSDGMLELTVSVPANTKAMVHIPAATPDAVTESGMPLGRSGAIRTAGMQDGRVVLELGSGEYRFRTAYGTTK